MHSDTARTTRSSPRSGSKSSKIHINNGTGIFDKTIDIPTTHSDDSYDVKLADLNNDGLLDIVIANSIDSTNGTTSKIFINKGNLSFELSDSKIGPQNSETKGIDVIDVDNDGYYDILLGNYNFANRIYRNNGTGHFVKMDVEILANPTNAIAAGDFNNDRFVDMVIGYALDTSVGDYRVYFNDGVGLQKNLPAASPAMLRSKISGTNVNLSWGPGFDRNESPLQFTESSESIGCLNAARLAVVDLNGDDASDIIVGNGEELAQESEVYLNNGSGHFNHSGQHFDAISLRDMVAKDIDNDGDFDWIVATQGDGVKIFKNNGSGFFELWQNIGDPSVYVRAVDLGDVDSDGDLDLLYGSIGNRIYLNDGNGNFSDSGQNLTDQYLTQAVKFGDLDSDGDLDFIQGNRVFGTYDVADRVFFNNGSGFFTDSGQRLGEWATIDIDLGDVDGDGDLDLVTASSLNGSNKFYLNNGSGFFTDSQVLLTTNPLGNESKAIKLGDIDHDGDLDIVLGDWNLGIIIFLNDGSVNFTKSSISFSPGFTNDVIAGDIDLDGDLDIVESKKQENCNRIYLNNQAASTNFSFTYNIRIGTQPTKNDIVSGATPNGEGYLGNSSYYIIKGLIV